MTYATLNKKAIDYAKLHQWFGNDRVPLISIEPMGPDELVGLTDEVSYIIAFDRLIGEQQAALINHYVEETALTRQEVEDLFGKIGGCPIPVDAVAIGAAQGRR